MLLYHHGFDETIDWCFHRQMQSQSRQKCEHHVPYVTVDLKTKIIMMVKQRTNFENNY